MGQMITNLSNTMNGVNIKVLLFLLKKFLEVQYFHYKVVSSYYLIICIHLKL